MIYISSNYRKRKKIKDLIIPLYSNGIKNIELTGGTYNYIDLEKDLLKIKNNYRINFLCHNYFPPSQKHFVINLASLNDEIYLKSIDQIKKNIDISKKLNGKKVGLHAGSFIDPDLKELGKAISKKKLFNRKKSIQRFFQAYYELEKYADGHVKLYVENNVISQENYNIYNGEPIAMLLDLNDYLELKKKFTFNLLLDVGHLKVNSNVFNFCLQKQLDILINETDYIHISDNNGKLDQHNIIKKNSNILKILQNYNISEKTVTLEMKGDIPDIKHSYNLINSKFIKTSKGTAQK